jgi:hypothetical protein
VARKHRGADSSKDAPLPAQPSSDEQSGSAGRKSGEGTPADGKDSGQGRYGQTGLGGQPDRKTSGQTRYEQSGPDGGQLPEPDSNRGSGRAEREVQDYQGANQNNPDRNPNQTRDRKDRGKQR